MIGVGVQPDLELDRWRRPRNTARDPRGCRLPEQRRGYFAAGDVAELRHPLLEGWHVLESVQNAVSQGKWLPAFLGQAASYTDVPWFWSDQFDCKLQMAGIPRAGDIHVRRENAETGGFSVFALANGRLNAVQCINSPRDYMVGRQLISHATEIRAHVLSDSQFNLKDLL
jgi:3-phenylpropionate/trans-cinnamate dioxygenase ferredoxin reductase subunit